MGVVHPHTAYLGSSQAPKERFTGASGVVRGSSGSGLQAGLLSFLAKMECTMGICVRKEGNHLHNESEEGRQEHRPEKQTFTNIY